MNKNSKIAFPRAGIDSINDVIKNLIPFFKFRTTTLYFLKTPQGPQHSNRPKSR